MLVKKQRSKRVKKLPKPKESKYDGLFPLQYYSGPNQIYQILSNVNARVTEMTDAQKVAYLDPLVENVEKIIDNENITLQDVQNAINIQNADVPEPPGWLELFVNIGSDIVNKIVLPAEIKEELIEQVAKEEEQQVELPKASEIPGLPAIESKVNETQMIANNLTDAMNALVVLVDPVNPNANEAALQLNELAARVDNEKLKADSTGLVVYSSNLDKLKNILNGIITSATTLIDGAKAIHDYAQPYINEFESSQEESHIYSYFKDLVNSFFKEAPAVDGLIEPPKPEIELPNLPNLIVEAQELPRLPSPDVNLTVAPQSQEIAPPMYENQQVGPNNLLLREARQRQRVNGTVIPSIYDGMRPPSYNHPFSRLSDKTSNNMTLLEQRLQNIYSGNPLPDFSIQYNPFQSDYSQLQSIYDLSPENYALHYNSLPYITQALYAPDTPPASHFEDPRSDATNKPYVGYSPELGKLTNANQIPKTI